MGKDTNISWCSHTFSPFWGCTRISPACGMPVPGHEDEPHGKCYAESLSTRWGFKIWGQDVGRRTFGDAHWAEPLKWNRAAEVAGERRRVFCGSMCDVMEDRRDLDAERAKLWPLIEATPWLIWMLTTKRPQNFRRLLPSSWNPWLPPNVWAIVTVETQDYLWRISSMMDLPFAVYGISCEPLLSEITLPHRFLSLGRQAWIIGGAESGPGARPTHPIWARRLRDDAIKRGVAFHWKQNGEWIPTHVDLAPPNKTAYLTRDGNRVVEGDSGYSESEVMRRIGKKAAGHLLDGKEWLQFPEAR